MDVRIEKFRDIELEETFFDSLRQSYQSFDEWFQKKKDAGEEAYVYRNPDNGLILDFLYLKPETEALNRVTPPMPIKKRLKIGTFKVTSRKTRSGEYFLKRALDRAIAEDVEECYVTIFPTDDLKLLISRFEAFGFKCVAQKEHSDGRKENVYVRNMRQAEKDVLKQYDSVTAEINKNVKNSFEVIDKSMGKIEENIVLLQKEQQAHIEQLNRLYAARIANCITDSALYDLADAKSLESLVVDREYGKQITMTDDKLYISERPKDIAKVSGILQETIVIKGGE